MRILEVITDTNIGGAGVLLVNRLQHTDLSKFDTTVVLPCGSKLVSRLKDISVKCIETKCSADRSFDICGVFEYIRILKITCPDIINCHASLSARIAAWLCRVPVKICTRHCVFPVPKKYRLIRWLSGKLNSFLSDKFIAVAHSARENLIALGVDERKITVIINGAQPLKNLDDDKKQRLKKLLGIPRTAVVLVICARLEMCKGHTYFLEAIKEIMSQGIEVTALIVGDGAEREPLQRLCREYGIYDSVIFTGFVDDVSAYMAIADINVNCSVGTETSSLALSEGMSIGLPAVVSDYGGNPYMVRHGENGFVYPCGDTHIMAEYIIKLVGDRELYEKMSMAARRRFADELNAKSMTEKTTSLYTSLYIRHVERG